MGAQIGSGLELIFLDQVSKFGIGAQLRGGLELLLGPPFFLIQLREQLFK